MSVIPYDLVATKMNFWYKALVNNWPDKAEKTKNEVRAIIDSMEENQDALIYYSLLEFRHQLQLDYLSSGAGGDLESRFREFQALRQTKTLEGMLEYYYNFFAGMYHFRQKELIHALNFYRTAENQLNSFDCDEVEKAEFYFKLSEVYYHMKQTFFSMNYATRAYNIFKNHETYGERMIQCQFIVAGNWLDKMYPEKALHNLNTALEESLKQRATHLSGTAHMNIGICYNQLEELDKSSNHLKKALNLYREENHSFLPKAMFNLTHVKAKQSKWNEVNDLYSEGYVLAEKYRDTDVLAKLKMIKGLYLEYDMDLIRDTFKFFEEKGMYADMEEYGVVGAELLERKEKVHDALELYRVAVSARRQIQRSGFEHEN
ncbi:tetratricopeptide repeat protein [Bacillus glycinifermentans]|uniref:response regulator aspartate phosphatase n=1 Tax=Bacillus glycinifermentans TaxID=1664069 RepID=UPI002DB569EF|nr:tetratricopeptide repeat protein [Bacillus glycinifermentans]MEC3606264.1 tetratricopeptide repeat protein [Bacillus glycinifermentans]